MYRYQIEDVIGRLTSAAADARKVARFAAQPANRRYSGFDGGVSRSLAAELESVNGCKLSSLALVFTRRGPLLWV